MEQSKTPILLPDQLPPTNQNWLDSTTPESDQDEQVECGYCHQPINAGVYIYSCLEYDDYWYLCEQCSNHQIRFCQYTNRFFPSTELVQLDEQLVVHQTLDEFISTYQILTNRVERKQLLDMHGVTQQITVTKQRLD